MRKWLALLLPLFTMLAVPSSASAGSCKIGLQSFCQEQSNWCWAATSKALIRHHTGCDYSQCQVVKWGKQSGSCPNDPGSVTDIKRALSSGGLTQPSSSGVISYSTVKSEIDGGKPFLFRAAWKASNKKTAHIIIANGYDDQGNDKQYIHMIEIQNCNSSSKTYKKTYAWAKDNDQWKWTDTIYGIKKR